jgi:hypothetical protein
MWIRNLSQYVIVFMFALMSTQTDAQPTHDDAVTAMHRAVKFFRANASASGGYVYQLSADLSRREGEGKVGRTTAWVQPPGTPSVGIAYLRAYQLTGDPMLLDAAKETASALLRGQLRSGGWDSKIEFAPEQRDKYAYRVDDSAGGKLRNVTTFDDDKSQSAIRFLMQLDKVLEFKDQAIHEGVLYALDGVVRSQYRSGAWPQRYSEFPDAGDHPVLEATIPKDWPRTYPGNNYAGFYTLNDNTMSDLIGTMLDAWDVYDDPRFLQAAVRGGDFLLRAQLPEPQPGWAQQYDARMQPAWARKFEPPAITGGESQGVMRTLILLYRRTAAHNDGAERFLQVIPRAIAYYRRSLLEDGRLARFYELGTNRPLFFTPQYELTYSAEDMPTHYAFIVSSKLDRIEAELNDARKTAPADLWKPKRIAPPRASSRLGQTAATVIGALDDRGAWVEDGRLRYHGPEDATREVIRSDTFCENLGTLADWIAAN